MQTHNTSRWKFEVVMVFPYYDTLANVLSYFRMYNNEMIVSNIQGRWFEEFFVWRKGKLTYRGEDNHVMTSNIFDGKRWLESGDE